MAVKGITQRWVLNGLGLILAILVVLELGMAFIVRSYYYGEVYDSLNRLMWSTLDSFTKYAESSDAEFRIGCQQALENFQLKENVELMVIGSDGVPLLSSTGFPPDTSQPMDDYETAKNSNGNRIGSTEFNLTSGEHVMAYTALLSRSENTQNLRAIRMVVSLEPTDQQVFIIVAILLAVGIAIILFVIMSGSYFISSIVTPVRNIGQTARRIALGDFDARLQKKYDDEIGDLCDTINYMASELSTNERMKNDFISSVSHELRTPLTAIKGWGETLMDPSLVDPETFQKGMSVIVSESERLSGIVEELLDFSRIQSGRMTLKMERIDILAELGEAVVMFRERSRRENIELLYHEPEILPPVVGDRNRLKQVFVNILDNAFKYSDPGGRIRVDACEINCMIQVVISDSGCGIPAKDLPRIKEKFYKANHTRRGSGIGLAVVDEIVSLHGGSLDIRSTEGVGTDVIIRIPVAKMESDNPPEQIQP
ncbi:sensor histidine kinase [Solibaculum mannosilyticum]|uniref:histidine kinase n=1 Tax=Solibaculum mannosilyticum TaxID=2780922 RepID=A0A7I8D3W5_9FIRM|nr:HAMP domain-containing sensor histidine kinase [Solibaculum mannosilyticum]BCI61508.1 sensor histidine kinase [Solibaculum mannosilyticum]CZT55737.1 Alkaline phosphatase synthesis sensor protein PhoR [Eubacteriaceae bacterium CHKCI005]